MTIIKIAVFLFGMCLSVQLVAALFSIIDLWYTIRTQYFYVIRKITLWGGVTLIFIWFFGNSLRPAFVFGIIAFILFHISFFLAGKALLKISSLSD